LQQTFIWNKAEGNVSSVSVKFSAGSEMTLRGNK